MKVQWLKREDVLEILQERLAHLEDKDLAEMASKMLRTEFTYAGNDVFTRKIKEFQS